MSPTQEGQHPTRILFVCLGNICRSPLAEGVFQHLLEEADRAHEFRVDSAGTGGWHTGEPPDPRSVAVAAKHGVRLLGRARKVSSSDFSQFDLIVAMDRENLRNLRRQQKLSGGDAKLVLLREFDPEANGELEVPDPYYGGPDGFDEVFRLVHRSCLRLVETLRDHGRPARGPGSPGEGG